MNCRIDMTGTRFREHTRNETNSTEEIKLSESHSSRNLEYKKQSTNASNERSEDISRRDFVEPPKPRRSEMTNSTEGLTTLMSSNLSITPVTDEDDSVSAVSLSDDENEEQEEDSNVEEGGVLPRSQETVEKIVRFSKVRLREYNLCLGDNPAVARGAPIALDWKYSETELCYSIDEFEKSEYSSDNNMFPSSKRTALESLKRPSLERLHLLKELGYSRREIKEATDLAQLIKEQRFQTRRKVERSDKIRAFKNALLCGSCAGRSDFIESFLEAPGEDTLGDSLSTVSTRGSAGSIDWSTVRTDVHMASPTAAARRRSSHSSISSRNSSASSSKMVTKPEKVKGPKRRQRRDWQRDLHQRWQQRKWQLQWIWKPRESLDTAHHNGVKLHNYNLDEVTSTGSLDTAHHNGIKLYNLDKVAT